MRGRILFASVVLIAGMLQANPIPTSYLELQFNDADKSIKMSYHLLRDYEPPVDENDHSGGHSDWDFLPVTHALRLRCIDECFLEGSLIKSVYELHTDDPLVKNEDHSLDPCVAPGEYLYFALDDFPTDYHDDYYARRDGRITVYGNHSCPEGGTKLCLDQATLDEIKATWRPDPEKFTYCDDDPVALADEDVSDPVDATTDNAAQDDDDTEGTSPDTDKESHSGAGCAISVV